MYIKVRVAPDSRKESLECARAECFVRVKEPARGGAANKRVREMLAAHFGVSTGDVRLVSGHHSPGKIFSIDRDNV